MRAFVPSALAVVIILSGCGDAAPVRIGEQSDGKACKDVAGDSGRGLDLREVRVLLEDQTLHVAWTTSKPLPSNDTSLFGVNVGGKSLELKYLNGVQTRYMVFDFGTRTQVAVAGLAGRDGTIVTGRFPMPGLRTPFDWRAFVFTHGDEYDDSCPDTGSGIPERTITYSG